MVARVSAICAIGKGGAIGYRNRLPWRIPDDSQRFRTLTMGHPVVMGRKTYQSIVKPLGGRTNIVITRQSSSVCDGCVVVPSLSEALRVGHKLDGHELFIAGGAEVYAQTLPICTRLYLTVIDEQFRADTFFPDYTQFSRVVSREDKSSGMYRYQFLVLERE
jgi:dihydrofolate reductase